MKTVYKTSKSPKKGQGLHTRKTNIQENSLVTKQTFHQKTFSMKTVCKTSLSPKNILQENGLQNKLFTKEKKNGLQNKPFTKIHSPRKRSTKQTVHQKNISKKTVYKTNLPPKKTQENGLQKRHWPQMFPKKTLNTRALAPKNAEDQTILVICRGCVK